MYSYLKFGLRKIKRNPTLSTIGILGLALGLTIFTILISYIDHERSYDHFHKNTDRIYKVISKFTDNNGKTVSFGISFGTLAEEVRTNFDMVEEVTRYIGPRNEKIEVRGARFDQIKVSFVDYSFFKLFDLHNGNIVFERPDQVCISDMLAEKLFPNQNPIGSNISFKGKTYEVSMIAEIPLNTQFQFDVIFPLVSMESYKQMVYHSGLEFHTYIMLKPEIDSQIALEQISAYYNKSLESRWDLYEGKNYMLPLRQLHLNSHGIQNSLSKANPTTLVVIASIAFFILILAIINYSNFQIAGAEIRARELNIRKVIGASKWQIFSQIISESIITALLAGFLGVLSLQTLSDFNAISFIDTQLFEVSLWGAFEFGFYIVIIVMVGIMAGLYPAFYLSKPFITKSALVKPKKAINSSILSLVVLQFAVSTTLLISILIISKQLDFMSNKPLGFDQENILVIKNFNHKEKYEQIKNTLISNPSIVEVSAAQSEPGGGTSGQFFSLQDRADQSQITVSHIRVQDNYINTFGLKIIHGEDFNYDQNGKINGFIINENTYSLLGNPEIGTLAEMGNRKGPIVGVVKNFHYRSLHSLVGPLVFTVEPLSRMTLSIKLTSDNLSETLSFVEKTLQSVDTKYILQYRFMDDAFASLYKKEEQTRSIATTSSAIAIFLSLMGLFALSIFLIHSRSKEVAIRKVIGAGILDLFWVLSSKIFLWIIVGTMISLPISWLFMRKWLETFSYRIDLSEYFLWAGPISVLIIVGISLISIIGKLLQAIQVNPIRFLKEE